ncbi:MAG: pyrroloquinoline quinone-dependent dehydrogenase, partial [Acidobacteriaceae bacterium]|nr:pyrroloquinoline quinone-dependent dehydrogenase [Acidobacteriaceae bacterium]
AYAPPSGSKPTQFEATPLYIDGTLYLSTPLGRVIALDPVTGTSRWSYDPHIDKDKGYGDYANRGVSTWVSPDGHRRIYDATIDARLIALDAVSGKPIVDFGDNGIVDLRNGLRIAPHWFSDYEETSPPAVVNNMLVVGSGVADNGSTTQASGEIRGFDTATGKLKWTWDPIPQNPNEPAYGTWKNGSAAHTGAANAWSVIAADAQRDLVFVPTGSSSPDYYGGERLGDNVYANCIVALKATTGEIVWHFQTVHHDLWDFDVATPPLLFDLHQNGETIPAIAVGSKTANLFILNRETGKPIFGVEERAVPKSDVPGEVTSPTQPFPLKPAPVARQTLAPEDAWGVSDADRAWCREEMSKVHTGSIFTPPSLTGTITLPGNIGGMNWGGMTYDPQHDVLVLPSNNVAAEMRLIQRSDYESMRDSRNRKLNGEWEFAPQRGTPYGMMRRLLLSPKGLPCTPPPWSVLLAISASTGEKKWEVPLGTLSARAPAAWGSISLGGPIATAGGLVFIGSTLAPALYAFDIETGKLLWTGDLPDSPKATPMTFEGPNHKQYVVVSAGGFGVPNVSPVGDYLVAFTL